ncbi:hypothetical protein PAMP_004035 [Pampus punctatissimus]
MQQCTQVGSEDLKGPGDKTGRINVRFVMVSLTSPLLWPLTLCRRSWLSVPDQAAYGSLSFHVARLSCRKLRTVHLTVHPLGHPVTGMGEDMSVRPSG